MADTTGPTAAVAKITEVVTGLWPGADKAADLTPEKTVPDEAERSAKRLRTSYDGIVRWIIGVFSAIGLLIFGAVPFADLDGVDLRMLLLALGLAGAGLAIVILAATSALELQDSSLGELEQTFAARRSGAWNSRVFPRNRASADLLKIVEGPEAAAHLGPGVATVEQLIERLGRLDKATVAASFTWDGVNDSITTELFPLPAEISTSPAMTIARSKEAAAALKTCDDALAELRKQRDDNKDDAEKSAVIAARLAAQEAEYQALTALLPSAETAALAAEITVYDALYQYYLDHRKLLLDESGAAQMRGTFRTARRWLILGATMVLAGGLLLTHEIANADDGEPKGPVDVTLVAGKDPWNAIEKCATVVKDKPFTVTGLLTESDDDDGAQDGPFTFVATSPECAGTTIEVAEGEGSYAPAAPVEDAATGQAARLDPVAVTVKPRTPEGRAVRASCFPKQPAGPVKLSAILLDVNTTTDPEHDGPFEILVTGQNCRTRQFRIAEGHGTYAARP